MWPGASPIGKRIKLGSADSLPWLTVVGIVGNIAERGRARDYAYVPFDQAPPATRTCSFAPESAGEVASAVRAAVREVDPDLPVVQLQTVEEQHNANYSPYKVYAMSMAVFAGFAIAWRRSACMASSPTARRSGRARSACVSHLAPRRSTSSR